MENELKSVGELLNKSFIVPSYQRGYRWTKFNVSQLLDDMFQYTDNVYNLQTLVVAPTDKENEFVIIDGQQRITTIFLIIACINSLLEKDDHSNFLLKYETRERSKDFLDFLSKIPNNEKPEWESVWEKFCKKYKESKENIDFRYMFQTYEVICDNIKKRDDFEKLQNHILKNCGFIWYPVEINNTSDEGQKVFNKMNMGKIYLTNSELIKSEFMNPIRFQERNFECASLLIAEKWNHIEKTLHNPDFWAFIPHEHQYGEYDKIKKGFEERNVYLSRIDEIFQLYLIKYLNSKGKIYKDELGNNSNSKYFIYEKLKEWIEEGKSDIEVKWGEIEKLFSNIYELYESDGRKKNFQISNVDKDDNIYNFVAYIIYMLSIVQEKSVLEVGNFIIKLLSKDRDKWKEELQSAIREGWKEIYGIKDIKEYLDEMKYQKQDKGNDKIKNIFLLFNIVLLQKNPAISRRYDFLNYRIWTIEHIYSQNEKILEYKGDYVKGKRKGIETKKKKIKEEKDNKKIEKLKKEIEAFEKECGEYESIPIKRKEIIDSLLRFCDEVQDQYSLVKTDFRERIFQIKIMMDFIESIENNRVISDENWKNFIIEDVINKYSESGEIFERIYKSSFREIKNEFEKNIVSVKENSGQGVRQNVIEELYDKIKKDIVSGLKKGKLKDVDIIAKIYRNEIDKYFLEEHNSNLSDDNISNLTLLRSSDNEVIGNEYIGKKEKLFELINSDTAIPYSTLLVFTDRYQNLREINNGDRWQWLLSSRYKYFDNILSILSEFLSDNKNNEEGN